MIFNHRSRYPPYCSSPGRLDFHAGNVVTPLSQDFHRPACDHGGSSLTMVGTPRYRRLAFSDNEYQSRPVKEYPSFYQHRRR
jgi:hypothetical protein